MGTHGSKEKKRQEAIREYNDKYRENAQSDLRRILKNYLDSGYILQGNMLIRLIPTGRHDNIPVSVIRQVPFRFHSCSVPYKNEFIIYYN